MTTPTPEEIERVAKEIKYKCHIGQVPWSVALNTMAEWHLSQLSALAKERDALKAEVESMRKDKERLDWMEKQATLAIWQGSFSDSEYNIKLGRAGAPICTISTMEPDGRESNDDEMGHGDSLRSAIDSALNPPKT
jgi:hypothetical protein